MGSHIALYCFILLVFVKSQKILDTKTTFKSLRCCEDMVERLENDQVWQRQEIINRNTRIEEYNRIILERDKTIEQLQTSEDNKTRTIKELERTIEGILNKDKGIQCIVEGKIRQPTDVVSTNITNMPDHEGTEFWLAFPDIIAYNTLDVHLKLLVIAETNTTLTIKMANETRIIKNMNEKISVIDIDNTFQQRDNTIEQKGITVKTKSSISLNSYRDNEGKFVDISWIPPVDKLGTDYLAVSYHPQRSYHSYISISAVHPDTSVNITLNITDALFFLGKTYHSGDIISIHLDEFYTVQLSHTKDLTGSGITSNKQISVQSGNTYLWIHNNNGGYNTFSSIYLPPLNTWGKTFVIPPIKTAVRMIIRVIPSAPNTVITITPNTTSYRKNDTLELNLAATDMFFAQCDNPCFVVQFVVAGPGDFVNNYMATIPAIEQYSREYHMITPGPKIEHNFPYRSHYVTIMIKSDGVYGLQLDESTIFRNNMDIKSLTISGQHWSVMTVPVQEGIHRIGHACSHTLYGAMTYGFGKYISYAYALGLNI